MKLENVWCDVHILIHSFKKWLDCLWHVTCPSHEENVSVLKEKVGVSVKTRSAHIQSRLLEVNCRVSIAFVYLNSTQSTLQCCPIHPFTRAGRSCKEPSCWHIHTFMHWWCSIGSYLGFSDLLKELGFKLTPQLLDDPHFHSRSRRSRHW